MIWGEGQGPEVPALSPTTLSKGARYEQFRQFGAVI
jgi:hypothetical protein